MQCLVYRGLDNDTFLLGSHRHKHWKTAKTNVNNFGNGHLHRLPQTCDSKGILHDDFYILGSRMSWNSQSILSHLFLKNPGSWWFVWRGVGSQLCCSFAHSTNKTASFTNSDFLSLILETPEGKTPYKRNNQAWPVFINFFDGFLKLQSFSLHGYQNPGNATNTKTWHKCTDDHRS